MEEALQVEEEGVEEEGLDSQVKEVEEEGEGEQAQLVLKVGVEAQTLMPAQHWQRTDQWEQHQTEKEGAQYKYRVCV